MKLLLLRNTVFVIEHVLLLLRTHIIILLWCMTIFCKIGLYDSVNFKCTIYIII